MCFTQILVIVVTWNWICTYCAQGLIERNVVFGLIVLLRTLCLGFNMSRKVGGNLSIVRFVHCGELILFRTLFHGGTLLLIQETDHRPLCVIVTTSHKTSLHIFYVIRDFKMFYGEAVVRRQIAKITSSDVMTRVALLLSRRSLAFYYGKVPSFTYSSLREYKPAVYFSF